MIPKFNSTAVALFGLALSFAAVGAQADPLVTNGSFESTTNGSGQMGYNTNATGWTTTGYNFIFAAGTADTTGANGQYGNLTLWGPGTGSANGLPASSPDGGNFIGADGDFDTSAITQTINGLTAGDQYSVGFWWAGAQQSGFYTSTTEQWAVSLGGQTQSTAILDNASEGFTGWQYDTMTFTADSSSDVLSFLAVGTPAGVPPFVLLDGVSMNQVPEPASGAMLLTGLAGLGIVGWYRRKAAKAAAGA